MVPSYLFRFLAYSSAALRQHPQEPLPVGFTESSSSILSCFLFLVYRFLFNVICLTYFKRKALCSSPKQMSLSAWAEICNKHTLSYYMYMRSTQEAAINSFHCFFQSDFEVCFSIDHDRGTFLVRRLHRDSLIVRNSWLNISVSHLMH